MINPKELRIGNVVIQGGGHILEVTTILTHGIQCFNKTTGFRTSRFRWHEIHPIPLTPEWLGRMRFQKSLKDFYELNGLLIVDEGDGEFIFRHNDKNLIYRHVHQLQNLFWCLCGQELEIDFT